MALGDNPLEEAKSAEIRGIVVKFLNTVAEGVQAHPVTRTPSVVLRYRGHSYLMTITREDEDFVISDAAKQRIREKAGCCQGRGRGWGSN